MDLHPSSRGRLVTTIESLLPVLSYNTDDNESSGSHHHSQEVFMDDHNTAATNNNLLAPIADQTPEELEATRLQLIAKREHLDEQQAKLARQCKDRQHVEALQGRGLQVNSALCLHERDGVPLFPTHSHNFITAIVMAHAINLSEGTPGHDELCRLKILMKEVDLQQVAISEGRAAFTSNT